MNAGRSAGLKPAQRKALLHQAFGQCRGGMGAVGTAVVVSLAHKDAPAQRGAGGDDQRLAAIVAV